MLRILFFLLLLGSLLFFLHPQFGKLPRRERLKRIKASPNYRDGHFQNLSPTPAFSEGASYLSVLKLFLFGKHKRSRPSRPLPSQKTNLLALNPKEDVLVWFGHSSYFLQVDGKKILVDPVFSGSASPLPFGTLAFEGSDLYTAADLPDIDYLLITHDHWDHLDYKTIKAIRTKVGRIITGLGTGEHLERWGYKKDLIVEKDWNERVDLEPGFSIHTTPARHFSGRLFKRNTVLWLSFVLQTPSWKLFLGGDSGYDSHFARIGAEFGPFDLAILENGQYNKYWKHIHTMPEEVLKAAKDLKAKKLFPVHNSKFSLSIHSWDEPLNAITENHSEGDPALVTPMIGEKVLLGETKEYSRWWAETQG